MSANKSGALRFGFVQGILPFGDHKAGRMPSGFPVGRDEHRAGDGVHEDLKQRPISLFAKDEGIVNKFIVPFS